MLRSLRWCALLAVLIGARSYGQVTLIQDDLNADTSSDYMIINGGWGAGDGNVDWAFDYSTLMADNGLAIPSAPGTTDGSTTGVRIQVNNTSGGDPADTEAYTIFHGTEITGVTDYTMTVDVFLGNWSSMPNDTGNTQHAHIGVAGDGVTPNIAFEASPFRQTGSGNFVFISSDGGDSSDYRHWRDDANGSGNPGTVNQFDPDYLSTDNGTNVIGANFTFFSEIANINAPFPGIIGEGWATIKVEVSQTDGRLRYYVRGASAETTGNPALPPEFVQIIDSPLFDTDGFVSFGLGDLYNSVAVNPDDQFAIFDNLFVEGSNPIGNTVDCDFNDDTACDGSDINMLMAEIASGANNSAFDLTGDGNVNNADRDAWLADAGNMNIGAPYLVADFDLDGNVNGGDFVIWNNNKFTTNSDWTAGNANGDSDVNGGDFVEWNNNKFTSSGTFDAVPEPGAGLLMLSALLLGVIRRR